MKNKNSIKLKQLYTRRKSTKPKVGVFKKINITDMFLARLLEGQKRGYKLPISVMKRW